jgi:hypothetical protein
MSRINEVTFDRPPRPRKIEDDAMFKGWNDSIPRLWFLDERQATRLDTESLYGAQEYAVLYNRATFLVLAEPIQTIEIGVRGYVRGGTTVIGEPVQTITRTVNYTRDISQSVPEPTQEIKVVRPTTSPVNRIVHPIEGDELPE